MRVEIWVPLKAVAKQRPRMTKRRRGRPSVAYTPKPTKDYEAEIGRLVREAVPEGVMFGSEPVCVNIDIHKSGFLLSVEHASCSVRPVGIRGDLDNLVKSIFDGLNGVLWEDDRQVELLNVGFVGLPRKGTEYGNGLSDGDVVGRDDCDGLFGDGNVDGDDVA